MTEAEAEVLSRLRTKRRAHRGVFTKMENEVEEILSDVDNMDLNRCEIISSQLDEKLKLLRDMDERIQDLCLVEDLEDDIEESASIERRILITRRKLHQALQMTNQSTQSKNQETNIQDSTATTIQPPQDSTATTSTSTTPEIMSTPSLTIPFPSIASTSTTPEIMITPSSTNPVPFMMSATPKLPKLELPKFKGNVTGWNTFWDSFKSAVHSNHSISKITKFNYLNSLLEGSASRCIQGLTLTEANYDAAIDLLQERYGKTQQIISAHMDEILKIQVCNGDRIGPLRYVYDKVSVHVRGLQSLGVAPEQYGSLLIPIVMSKLPSDIRLQIARKTSSDVWKIDELLQIIKKEIDAREICEAAKANASNNQVQSKGNTIMSKGLTPPTVGAFVVNDKKTITVHCAFCHEIHYSASCDKVKNIEVRRNILRDSGRCFCCLRKSHVSSECPSNKKCRHCGGKHHQSICNKQSDQPQRLDQSQRSTETIGRNNESSNTTTATTNTTNGRVLLQTAKAIAINGSRSVPVRVLFDNGSQRSYVTDNLRTKLKLDTIKKEQLNLNTFGESKTRKQTCDFVELSLYKPGYDELINVKALTFPVICTNLPSKVRSVDYAHLHGLFLADEPSSTDTNNSIDVLIGSDYYWHFITGEMKRGDNGPVAVHSKLGWLLSGNVETDSVNGAYVIHTNLIIENNPLFSTNQDDVLAEQLKNFWETESIGIKGPDKDREINDFAEDFCNDIKFQDGRYEVKLPWKHDQTLLSDHRSLCENRLRQLHRKLIKDKKLLSDYDQIIKEQLDKGIIVKSDKVKENASVQGEFTHFIPHLPVVRQDRITSKTRIVYDASSKSSPTDKSLNDCLKTGPNLIPHIFNVLAKFRLNKIGLCSDIQQAFLMVGIQEDQRKFLSFLWFDDPNSELPEIVEYKFTRLVFGLRPSPAILGTVILHHMDLYKQSEPEMAKLLAESLYVDDLITGEQTEENALAIYRATKRIMLEGGFNLRKWKSNSPVVQQKIDECEGISDNVNERDYESYAKISTNPSSSTSETNNNVVNVLGMKWNTFTDELCFDFGDIYSYTQSLPLTKRSVLKISAKLFDPMGYLTPFTVCAKILFQELCREKINWDEELKGEQLLRWKSILEELNHLDSNGIPRCYFTANPINVQLHGFCDASEKAYAAVVYIRSCYDNGKIDVKLVASKSRVAPLHKQSIPRLELLGALILARLSNELGTLKFDFANFWTDSMTTLCWIRNERVWKQYVGARVDEIRRLTPKELWKHCPGEQNPADLPSRGITSKELCNELTWWTGPEFLYLSESEWPSQHGSVYQAPNEEVLKETVKKESLITHSLMAREESDNQDKGIHQIINTTNYSTLNKLLRVTAYVNKFVSNLKARIQDKQSNRNLTTETVKRDLTVADIKEAEISWIKAVQVSAFKDELLYCKGRLTKTPTRVMQFGLILNNDGVMRCKGRINKSSLEIDSKNPILLPSNHDLVRLLIQHVHQQVKHSGINITLTTLRERFWILRGRQAVKRFVRKCVVCRKVEGPPYATQPMPDLPHSRVSEDPPFTHIGLDFAGPLYIQEQSHGESESKNCNKVYVLLITCASTRAIHLELTLRLTVEDFLLAFRRYAGRRGLPATITSDNAKTFRSSSKEIRKITRSSEVWKYLTDNQITWKFIIEKAPWWGGYWERLVQSVKTPLKKVIGRSTLNFDQLRTLIVEIEGVINSRPLTYIYDDEESISYPLTPSDLIYGRRITSTPNGSYYEIQSTYRTLTRKLKHHRNLLYQVTTRWKKEYLTGLREHSLEKCKKDNSPNIKEGDIVILKNDKTNRTCWKLAKVEELIPSADGRVRAAIVNVSRDSRRPARLRRVTQHLIPIEVRCEQADVNNVVPLAVNNQEENNARPRRNAAITGELLRRLRV